jgi:hypothetical protein
MTASIRQADNIGFSPLGTTYTYTIFEKALGMENVQAGDAIVVCVQPNANGVPNVPNVLSVTDNYGNTYRQIPGARSVASSNDWGVDFWWAQNVAQVNDPGITISSQTLALTVTLDSVPGGSGLGVVVFDIEGINGATPVCASVGTTSTLNAGRNSPFQGPSLNGGSGAVFLSALVSLAAGSGGGNQAPRPGSIVESPWDIIVIPGISDGGGYAYVELGSMAVASLLGSGTQQATFELTTNLISPSEEDYVIGGVAFVVSSGGTGPLANYNVGDTISDGDIDSIAPPAVDNGHVAYSTVYSGTLRDWNGEVGIIFADPNQGDASLPTQHSGEGPLVRVQLADVTYAPTQGDRVKFLLYRTSAGDKLAKAVSLIS